MDDRTLKALEGAIRKWKEIETGAGHDLGPNNCDLCKEFYDDLCAGCPVRAFTKRIHCKETPYEIWGDEQSKMGRVFAPYVASTPKLRSIAKSERRFLQMLLASGAQQ